MKVNKVVVPRWFDRHLHLRTGKMLKTVLPCTLNQRATGAVIMGNIPYPNQTSTIAKALAYRKEITSLIPVDSDFNPRMTYYLTDDTSPEEVMRGYEEGVWCAAKLYMANQKGHGGTTGSQHGVKNLLGRYPVFAAMEREGIPLLGHFEAVEEDVDEFDREIVSLERDLIPLLKAFPELMVVFEHITDGRAADFVAQAPYQIRATVTAHHLMMNRNAMFWIGMNPANYCRPVPKREDHRLKVRKYVTGGNRRFGAGTDSAPHDEEAKSRCYGCAAGIFTAPAAVEMYTTVFDEDDALKHLGPFLSENFLCLYEMKVSNEMMTIERTCTFDFWVPQKVGTVQIFAGGRYFPWKLVD
ncbi:MAG: dihydroorotase [Candidatus Kaiserbacteria bacterium]|nr:dihydroorotase [Candidatus Kaiserbacteria bacterium]